MTINKETIFFSNKPIDFTYSNLEFDPLFFTKLMAEGFRRKQINIEQHHLSAVYISGILENHAKKNADFNSVENLIIELYTNLKKKPNDTPLKIKFADNIVFYNGLFPNRKNKLLDFSFYNRVAKGLYLDNSFIKNDVFYSLAFNLDDYLGALHEVCNVINELQNNHFSKYVDYT